MDSLNKFLKLARKTNSKFIVYDSNNKNGFVILPLDEYEDLVDLNLYEYKEDDFDFKEFDSELLENNKNLNLGFENTDFVNFENEESEKDEEVDFDFDSFVEEDVVSEIIETRMDEPEKESGFEPVAVENLEEEKKSEEKPFVKTEEKSSWHSTASILLKKKEVYGGELLYDEIGEEKNDNLEAIELNEINVEKTKKTESSEPVFYEEPV